MVSSKRFFSALVWMIFLCWIPNLFGQELYFIDAHSQADHDINLDILVDRMRKAGIAKTILAARGKRKSRDIVELANQYPNEIIPSVRTKGRHYKNNSEKYYKKIARQVNSGHFHAMAEIILFHAQKGDRAEEVRVFPHDRRVEFALKFAKQNKWPLVLHIEFASLHGELREKYVKELIKFLRDNKDHPIALIHMGQLPADETDALLKNHTNLYFLTSHANTISVQQSNQPWINMFTNDKLSPEWKKIIESYPNRFIFSIDNVWPEHWLNNYEEQVSLWRKALQYLPSNVAHAVAHGNAERLWKLNNTQ